MLSNRNSMQDEVSVVLCTYNGNRYIGEQLTSILNQTHPPKELLIFDDASTDGTWETLQSWQAKYPHVSLSRNANTIGFNANFQQALLAASSNIIAIADQDDIWELNKIALLLEAWTDDTPMIYCDSVRFTDNDITHVVPLKKYNRYQGKDARRLYFSNTVSGHAALIRKSFLQYALPFPTGIYYDWWMAVVASYNGGVRFLDKILVYQRVHGQNASVVQANSLQAEFLYFRQLAVTHINQFVHCRQMPEAHQKFTNRLLYLFAKRKDSVFIKWQLTQFIFSNRKILFNTKMGKSAFSYAKYAYRWAFR